MEETMDQVMFKAQTLIEALPYIRDFNNKRVIVKYGGSAMLDENLQSSVIKDVALLKLVGMKPMIVHGGGKEISKWLKRVGKETAFVEGLRVTDEETMEVAEMVLNKVNKDLVRMLEQVGVRAVGISGKDGGMLRCRKKVVSSEGRSVDIGYVGNVVKVDTDIIDKLLEDDYIPIIAPIGLGMEDYKSYNINADDAASSIAKAMKAEKLAFLTDIDGVCTDPDDKSTLLSTLTVPEAEKLILDGYIHGGMLPKLRNCIDAVIAGVQRVHIIDGRKQHCLLLEFFTNKGVGTAILSDEKGWFDHE